MSESGASASTSQAPLNVEDAAIPDALTNSEDLWQARREACRKGGLRSGVTRREQSRRRVVERAICHQRACQQYDRNAAAKIARYLGVSDRYVRLVASEMLKKTEAN